MAVELMHNSFDIYMHVNLPIKYDQFIDKYLLKYYDFGKRALYIYIHSSYFSFFLGGGEDTISFLNFEVSFQAKNKFKSQNKPERPIINKNIAIYFFLNFKLHKMSACIFSSIGLLFKKIL